MEWMNILFAIAFASSALLGNIALAGMHVTPFLEEPTMTSASHADLALMSPLMREAALCRNAQEKHSVHSLGSRDACPTDHCIVEFGDQAKHEAVALLLRAHELASSAAITVEGAAYESLGVVHNHRRQQERKNLVATITSSVIFRE